MSLTGIQKITKHETGETIMSRTITVRSALRSCGVLALASFAVLALAASTAGAASISGGPSTFTYSDTGSQTNTLSVTSASSTSVDISDSTGTLSESSSYFELVLHVLRIGRDVHHQRCRHDRVQLESGRG